MDKASADTFRQKTVSSIGWSAGASLAVNAIQLGASIELARLLPPSAFGQLGMLVVFTGFATLFAEMGLAQALIHRRDVRPEHYSSVFWLNVAAGLALTGIFLAAAPLIAGFYHEPDLKPLCMALAPSFFIGSLRIVQGARIRKQFNFRGLAFVDVTSLVISLGVGITLAKLGMGVWSLVIQILVQMTVHTILLWFTTGWRPALQFRWDAIRDLLGFSGSQLGVASINYWRQNSDNMLIGRYVGDAALGIYTKAYSIMLRPTLIVATTIGQVMFPALAIIQDDKRRTASIYLRATRAIALLTFPLTLGLMVVADDFVLAVFRSPWAQMIGILQVLSFVSLLQSTLSLNANLFLAQGRTKLSLQLGIVTGLITVASFIVGLRWGVLGVAYGYAISQVVILYPTMRISLSVVDLTVWELARKLRGILGCAIAMALCILALRQALPAGWTHGLRLTAQVALGAGVYAALIHFIGLSAYRDARETIAEQLHRRALPEEVDAPAGV